MRAGREARPSSGTPVDEALEAFGWTVVADGVRGEGQFRVGVRWAVAALHTGPILAEADSLGVDVARFILGLAGTAEIDVAGTRSLLPPRHALVVLGDQPLTVRADEEWTRLEWHIMAVPSGLIRARVIQPTPFHVNPGVLRLVDSMTRSLIVDSPARDSRAQTFLYRLLSQAVVAAIADDLRLGSSKQRLFERAQHMIEAEYLDPSLTAERLSTQLNVSRSYLYEVYAEYGTTPRKEIERHRIGSVRARFDLDDGAPATELLGVGGFSSPQQMRDTIARFEQESPGAGDAWGRTD